MAIVHFEEGFHGTYEIGGQTLHINKEGGIRPYDMTFGAIACCFYSTYLDVLQEKGLNITGATVEVTGEKRETIPTTLEKVHVCIEVVSQETEAALLDAFKEAFSRCSMVQTVNKVADVTYTFKTK